jgi:hypothetical protein
MFFDTFYATDNTRIVHILATDAIATAKRLSFILRVSCYFKHRLAKDEDFLSVS